MKKTTRFVIWICSKFTRFKIEQIIQGLLEVLANRNPEVKPKDDFKEKHPNYRNFFVDPEPPLKAPPPKAPKLNWKELLSNYQKERGYPLLPVNNKDLKDLSVESVVLPQNIFILTMVKNVLKLKCKVCSSLSQVHPRHRNKARYFCPHCGSSLYLWKERKEVSIYKCDHDKCSHFKAFKAKLNFAEKLLTKVKSSQFKLRYQFRDYHFTQDQLRHSAPEEKDSSCLFKIHNSLNTLCLVLTFHLSLGISARKTAFVLRKVFSLPLSYQNVLNYTEIVAPYGHRFNLAYKGEVDHIQAGDEAYSKVRGKNHFVFFFISSCNRKITAYHIEKSRETLPAVIAMQEAIRTASP